MEYHIINAFTDAQFHGNPAGVCLPAQALPDALMQKIAAENNLSETAFLLKQGSGRYNLRWFTPTVEVDLCGHATLAGAYALFNGREKDAQQLTFETKSGTLTVERAGEWLALDLPAAPPVACPSFPFITRALGIAPLEVYASIDFLAVVEDEAALRGIQLNAAAFEGLLSQAGEAYRHFGIIATARGEGCDFVSRYFAPNVGIPEDPVTGSAHCTLTPYWAAKLGKNVLEARQLSPRGGLLRCENRGKRVIVRGQAVHYLTGMLAV